MSTDLSNLEAPEGATQDRKRVGRGPGSTWGKTCGRGQKGQKARSGGSISPGFEGGQTPLYRRLPKHGFNRTNRTVYSEVNVSDLETFFEEGDTVDFESLKERGLTRKSRDGVKILGDGEITKSMTVKAHKFSKSAVEKIEKAGGSVEVI